MLYSFLNLNSFLICEEMIITTCSSTIHAQIQFLLTWIHNCDVDNSGLITFNKVLVALRAVPVVYPGGRIEAGNFDPPPNASGVGSRVEVGLHRIQYSPVLTEQFIFDGPC
jgi:hypothetical protein